MPSSDDEDQGRTTHGERSMSSVTSNDDDISAGRGNRRRSSTNDAASITSQLSVNPFVVGIPQPSKAPEKSWLNESLVNLTQAQKSKKKIDAITEWGSIKDKVSRTDNNTKILYEKLCTVTSQGKEIHRIATDALSRGKTALDDAAKELKSVNTKYKKKKERVSELVLENQTLSGEIKINEKTEALNDKEVNRLEKKVKDLEEEKKTMNREIDKHKKIIEKLEAKVKDSDVEQFERKEEAKTNAYAKKVQIKRQDADKAAKKKSREKQSRFDNVITGGGSLRNDDRHLVSVYVIICHYFVQTCSLPYRIIS